MRWGILFCMAFASGCLNRGLLEPSATLEVNPDSLPADGVSVATVTLDAHNGTGTALQADTVFQLLSNSNATSPPFGPPDGNGLRYTTIRSTTPGTQTLSLTASSQGTTVTMRLSDRVSITFTPVAPRDPSAALSKLTANPNLVADDGQTSTQLTVHVVDGFATAMAGVAVTFTSTGSNNFFTPIGASGLTDANGDLTVQLASTTPEVKTVIAHIGSVTVSTQVTFSPVGASSAFSTLHANPNVLRADGVSTTLLTVTVFDNEGLPLPYAPITWSATGSHNTLIAGSSTADVNGVATATLASTVAEAKTITASSGAMQVSTQVLFQAGSISNANCTLVTNPNDVVADNTSVSTLTFRAADAFGNGVSGAPVTFTVSGSNNTLTPTFGTTDSNGVFAATLSSTMAETKTVTATSGTISLQQPVVFAAGPPDTVTSSLTVNPTVVTANGSATSAITVTLVDNFSNPIPGYRMTFSSTGSGTDHFSSSTGTTNSSGQTTVTLSSTTAESDTVIATFTGGSLSADVTFVAGAPSSTMSTLTASPTTVTANGTSSTALTATVLDAFGNPVDSQLVSLSATGSNSTVMPQSGTTDSAGVFTATMTSTSAGAVTVTATAASATATAAVTFVAGPPSSTTTSFVANPMSVTADGTSQSTLTVTVEDAQGNPVANQSVSIATTGTNNTFSPSASGTTNSAGVLTATLASTTAETKNLTATIAGSITKNTGVAFVAGVPASATTTLSASPNTVSADASHTTMVTVTVRDAHNNPIANQSVTLGSSGSNNFFGSATGTTDSAGVYTTTLASSKAEVKTITATAGAANKTTTVTFVAGTPTSANCSVAANPTSLVADGITTTQLTFSVQDSFGNPVPNQAVSLASSGSANTFTTAASGTTNSAGQFVANFASTRAETKTITGTAGSAAATTSVMFTAGVVSGTTTTLVANPNSAAADGSSLIALVTTALDAQGNPVAGQSVSLSGSGTLNTFVPSSGSTNAAGQFTSNLSSTANQNEVISAQVAGSVTVNANVSFTTPLVNVTSSSIVASPNSLIADGTTTTSITVTVLNDSNAPVVGATVVMSATGTANTFAPASGTTNGAGVFTTTLKSTQAAVKTVTATVDGAALNTNVTFSPGPATQTTTTLVASPNTVTADGASISTLTVVVNDINGNRVPNQSVSLALSGGNNTMVPVSGSGTTDATGTFTATLASTLAQTETVTATVNAFTENTNVTFVPGTVSGATTTFVASPNTATANNTNTVVLTATVRDAEGNPVPNQSVVLASTGSNNTFFPPSGSTNGAGVFTATMATTTAQLKVVTATIGTVNENANVLYVPGPPSSGTSTLVLNPASVTANGNTTAITVTVKDAQHNPISGQTVSLSGSGSANTFTPLSGPTNANGVFTATLSSTLAQSENVIATAGSATLTAPITFTPGSPNSVTSALAASPTSVVANGVATTTLTVTVKDAQGNPVPAQAVSFSSNGSSNNFSQTSGTTTAGGAFAVTFWSTMAQVKLVTASINGGAFTETASVTFTAGTPSNSTTTIVASPNSLTADGTSTSTLTVTVEDQYGNPVPNQNVLLSSTGSTNTFAPAASGATNNFGVFTATLASTTAEVKTITATIGALTPTATVTFVAGAPTTANSSVTVSPSTVTANGSNTTTVTVTAKDLYGNLVPNQSVSLNANGTGNFWAGTSGSTNASGVWTTTLASTVAQTETITATIGTVTETVPITFVAGAPANATSSLTSNPNSVTADGASAITFQIRVADAENNPVGSQAVTFASTGSSYAFSATTCNTSVTGVCSVTLTSTLAQTVTVTATFAGLAKTAVVTFVAGPATSGTSSLAAAPTSLADDGVTTTSLQVTVEDVHSNPITGQAVTFSTTGSSYAFSSTTCTTAAGQCSVTLKSTLAQTVTVTAAFASINKTAAVTFVLGSPNSTESAFSASPTSLPDDGTSTTSLQVTVKDSTANAITGQAVTFSSTGTGTSFSSMSCTTAAGGTCSVTLKSTGAGTDTVSAKFAGITLQASVTFVTGSPNTTASFLTATPSAVTANGTATSSLQITVNDATSNPVNNQAVTFSSTGASYTFSGTTCTTTAAGTCSVTLKTTLEQNVTVTAAFAGHNETAAVTFLAGAPSNPNCAMGAAPTVIVANNSNYTTVTMTVRDAFNNPVPNQPVTFTSSGSSNTFTPTVGTTGANGTVTSNMTSTVAQAKTITVSTGSVSLNTNVVFIAGPPALSHTTLVASPNVVTGDGNATSTVTLTAADAYGNIVANANVTFSASSYGSVFSNRLTQTNASGIAQTTVKSVYWGQRTIKATLSPIAPTTLVTFSPPASCAGEQMLFPDLPVISTPSPTAVATTDFNGDGLPDMAVTNNGNKLTVALGIGNGAFATAVAYRVGASASDVAVGDLNGDGHPDCVVTNAGEGNVTVLLGVGNGNLNTPVNYSTSTGNVGLAVGDLNGDGRGDVVYINSSGSLTARLAATGGILSTISAYVTSASPVAVALADMSNDGRLDAVVVGTGSQNVDVYLGNGSGTFGARNSYPATYTYTNATVAVADFNADGNQDVVVGSNANDVVQVLLGNGTGALGSIVQTTLPNQIFDLGAADMNGDGKPDLLVGAVNAVYIAVGNGDGTFQSAQGFNAGNQSSAVATADVNGDGYQDVFTVDNVAGNTGPLLGTGTGSLSTGNINSTSGLGTNGAVLADFNGDGNQDFALADYYGQGFLAYLGKGDGTFTQKGAQYHLGYGLQLAVGNLDANTTPDIVVAADNNTMIGYTGAGNGNFTAHAATGLNVNCVSTPSVKKLGSDLYDAVVMTCPLASTMVVLRSNGDGTFAAPVYYATGLASSVRGYVALADFNGDGYNDAMVTSVQDPDVALFIGTSTATFSAPTFITLPGNFTDWITAGVFENNGRQDAAVVVGDANVVLLHNNGSGGFVVIGNYTASTVTADSVSSYDMDGDGWLDILVAGGGSISIVHSPGSAGTGSSIVTIPYLSSPSVASVAGGDFNRDGFPDLLTASFQAGGAVGDFYVVNITSGCVP